MHKKNYLLQWHNETINVYTLLTKNPKKCMITSTDPVICNNLKIKDPINAVFGSPSMPKYCYPHLGPLAERVVVVTPRLLLWGAQYLNRHRWPPLSSVAHARCSGSSWAAPSCFPQGEGPRMPRLVRRCCWKLGQGRQCLREQMEERFRRYSPIPPIARGQHY